MSSCVERREDRGVGGVSVHVGARVMACAGAGEVLASRTLRDILLACLGLTGDT